MFSIFGFFLKFFDFFDFFRKFQIFSIFFKKIQKNLKFFGKSWEIFEKIMKSLEKKVGRAKFFK